MNTVWIIWILAILVSFTVLEARAFKHPEKQNTLSRFIWSMGQKFPLSLVVWGMLIGGLSVHFYWNWNPLCQPPGVGG